MHDLSTPSGIDVRATGQVGSFSAPRTASRGSLPLWSVLTGGLVMSVALGFALRALGRGLLDVPSDLPSLVTSALLPATIFPVLGNCFGYYMSFRAKPSRHSMRLFIGISAVMAAIGIVISASKLPGSANLASVATTIAVSLISSLLIISALLLVVARFPEPR
ncbi:MAG: hypothetical protein ACRDNS_08840 [Trebonia sp.]